MVNVKKQKLGQNTRMSFAKNQFPCELPSLVEVQTKSFKWFLEEGLKEVLEDVSPITDHANNLVIEFVSYSIDKKTKYTVEECKERDTNYAAPLKVGVRLTNRATGEVKETEIFMGDFPIMTETGTFVINGAERVIVSQIIRSPGMYYATEVDKNGKDVYSVQVIPYRGAWLEYEFDANDAIFVRIDKTRKLPLTVFIRALMFMSMNGKDTKDDIYELFGEEPLLNETFVRDETEGLSAHSSLPFGVEALKEIYKKLRPGEPATQEAAQNQLHNYFFDPKRYDIATVGRYKFNKKLAIHSRIRGHKLAETVVSPLTGEVLFEAGAILTNEDAHAIENAGVNVVMLELDNGKVKLVGQQTLAYMRNAGADKSAIANSVLSQLAAKIYDDGFGGIKTTLDIALERMMVSMVRDDVGALISIGLSVFESIKTTPVGNMEGRANVTVIGFTCNYQAERAAIVKALY